MTTQVQQFIEQAKSSIQDCKECPQGIAVTTEGLCEVCDAKNDLLVSPSLK